MSEPALSFVDALRARFGDAAFAVAEPRGEITMDLPHDQWLTAARALRDEFGFEQLMDLCGVDYLGYGSDEWDTDVSSEGFSRGVEGRGPGRFAWGQQPTMGTVAPERRFAVVAHLLSVQHNRRLRIRTFALDDDLPVVDSLMPVWRGVNWFEREAFDMFGIVFEGHPDLRRILTDYGFVGHPFRKDFPQIGNVEVIYDAERRRVVYKPVSIEPRVLVPRVVREDARYQTAADEATSTQQIAREVKA